MASARGLMVVNDEARACTRCAAHLAHDPRPVFRVGRGARIAIIGPAPGSKVHASGVPWQDDAGARLLAWLGLDRETFDDPDAVAILPMSFCWPGRKGGAELPPRPECAPAWHGRFLAELPRLRLTLLVGPAAQAAYLGAARKGTLTETVRAFADYLPRQLPLPHPSGHSTAWMKRNRWFARTLLPVLRKRVGSALTRA